MPEEITMIGNDAEITENSKKSSMKYATGK